MEPAWKDRTYTVEFEGESTPPTPPGPVALREGPADPVVHHGERHTAARPRLEGEEEEKGDLPHHVATLGCCTCLPTGWAVLGQGTHLLADGTWAQASVAAGAWLGPGAHLGHPLPGQDRPLCGHVCILTHAHTDSRTGSRCAGLVPGTENTTVENKAGPTARTFLAKGMASRKETVWSFTVHYLNSVPQATHFLAHCVVVVSPRTHRRPFEP